MTEIDNGDENFEDETDMAEGADEGADGDDEQESPNEAEPAPVKVTAAKKSDGPGAHELFVAGLMATARALGLQYQEKSGYHQFIGPANKQKVNVAKQAKEVTYVDTTLPRAILGEDITEKLPKPNGKIECLIKPSADNVTFALQMLADPGTPALRAAKRQAKAKPAEAPATSADKRRS